MQPPTSPQRSFLVVPRPLRWLVPLMIGYGLLLVALPVQMALSPEALAETVRRRDPSLTPEWVEFAVLVALLQTVVLHAVSLAVAVWFSVKAVRGRRWARIGLTVYVLLAALSSLGSASAGVSYLVHVIATNVIHVVLLGLLWLPGSVREFFAAPGRTPPDDDPPHG